jgi:hypothetical protein
LHLPERLRTAIAAAEVTVIGEDKVEIHGNTCTLRISQTIIITDHAALD